MPQRGGRLINRDDWLPMRGEGKKHYALRLMREGHTMPDAFMTCACAQIGQVREAHVCAQARSPCPTVCLHADLGQVRGAPRCPLDSLSPSLPTHAQSPGGGR